MPGQHLAHRRAHGRQLRGVQRGLGVDGGVAGGEQELVALAERQLELLGQAQDHLAARAGPAGLHEAQVPSGDLRLEREVELAQPAALAPPPQQLADRALALRCARHVVLTTPARRRRPRQPVGVRADHGGALTTPDAAARAPSCQGQVGRPRPRRRSRSR